MPRLLLAAALLAASAALAAGPVAAGDGTPTHRKYYYTPHYRNQPARRAPAHQRSFLRSAGPVRKVWHRREWWQRHDQDEIVIDEDDGIVIEADDDAGKD